MISPHKLIIRNDKLKLVLFITLLLSIALLLVSLHDSLLFVHHDQNYSSSTNNKIVIHPVQTLSLKNKNDRDTLMTMDLAMNFQFQHKAIPEIFQLQPEPVVPEVEGEGGRSDKKNNKKMKKRRQICEPFRRRRQNKIDDDDHLSRRSGEFCGSASNLEVVDLSLYKKQTDGGADSTTTKKINECLNREEQTLNRVKESLLSKKQTFGTCMIERIEKVIRKSPIFSSSPKNNHHDSVLVIGFHLTNDDKNNKNPLPSSLLRFLTSFVEYQKSHPNYILHLLFDDALAMEEVKKQIVDLHDAKIELILVHNDDYDYQDYTPSTKRIFLLSDHLRRRQNQKMTSSSKIIALDTRDMFFQQSKSSQLFPELIDEEKNAGDFVVATTEIFPLVAAGHTRLWMEQLMLLRDQDDSISIFEELVYYYNYNNGNFSSSSYRLLPDGQLLPVLNSGFFGGSFSGMIKYLELAKIILECSSAETKKTVGMDQAVMNLIAYFVVPVYFSSSSFDDESRRMMKFYAVNTKVVPSVVHFVRDPKNDGVLLSRGTEEENDGKIKMMVDCRGRVYGAVHQLDRHPELL